MLLTCLLTYRPPYATEQWAFITWSVSVPF